MKKVAKSAMCALMTMMLICAVLGSKGAAVTVRAEELNNESIENSGQMSLGTVMSSTLDVCFYIRGDSIGADIPSEPAVHLGEIYSAPIRINDAVAYDFSESSHEVDGQEADLLSDGFTASNEVSNSLYALPSAGDIASVVDGFDATRHYVVWYVIKTSPFSYPYSDVYVHVDGVIRERNIASDPEEEEPEITKPTDQENQEDPKEEPKDPARQPEPADPAQQPEPTKPSEHSDPTKPSEQPEPTNPEPAKPEGKQEPEKTEPTKPAESDVKPDQKDPAGSTKPDSQADTKTPETSTGKTPVTDVPTTDKTSQDTPVTDKPVTDKLVTDDQSTQEPPGDDTAQLTEAEEVISEVTLEVRALFLENGVECKEIEYDGSEHIIGGFEIVIHDKETGNPLVGYLYECYGQFLGIKSYADDGTGTQFTYKGQEFWINVVKAFARVVNPGDSQEVIFYDVDDRPLREAADFIIKDQAGNVLPARFNVVPTTDTVTVKKRDITIEAGTSVRNDSGQTLTDDSYTISQGALMDGHRIDRVVINGSQTGAGRSLNEISDITIVDANGNPVNDQYNIQTVNGELILVEATQSSSDETSEPSDTAKEILNLKEGTVVVTGNSVTEPAVLLTESVSMESADSAGVTTAQSQVLGARRAETGDPDKDIQVRMALLAACFAAALAMLLFREKN